MQNESSNREFIIELDSEFFYENDDVSFITHVFVLRITLYSKVKTGHTCNFLLKEFLLQIAVLFSSL